MRSLMMVLKVRHAAAAAVAVLAITIAGSTAAYACSFPTKPLEVAFSMAEQVRALPRGEDTPIAAEIEITGLQAYGPLTANVVEVLWGRVETATLTIWPSSWVCGGPAHRIGERAFVVGRMERGADGSTYFLATRFPWSSVHTVEPVFPRRRASKGAQPDAIPTDDRTLGDSVSRDRR